jgi:hypothetical protein
MSWTIFGPKRGPFSMPLARVRAKSGRSWRAAFPSDLEIRRGIIAFSKPELDEMRSKVRRFRDILAATGHRSPQVGGGFDRDLDDGDHVGAVGDAGRGPS